VRARGADVRPGRDDLRRAQRRQRGQGQPAPRMLLQSGQRRLRQVAEDLLLHVGREQQPHVLRVVRSVARDARGDGVAVVRQGEHRGQAGRRDIGLGLIRRAEGPHVDFPLGVAQDPPVAHAVRQRGGQDGPHERGLVIAPGVRQPVGRRQEVAGGCHVDDGGRPGRGHRLRLRGGRWRSERNGRHRGGRRLPQGRRDVAGIERNRTGALDHRREVVHDPRGLQAVQCGVGPGRKQDDDERPAIVHLVSRKHEHRRQTFRGVEREVNARCG